MQVWIRFSSLDIANYLGISLSALRGRLDRWRTPAERKYNLRNLEDLQAFINRSKELTQQREDVDETWDPKQEPEYVTGLI